MKLFDEWFYRKVRWVQKRAGIDHPDWKDHEDYLDEVADDKDYSEIELNSSNQISEDDPHRLYDGLRIDIKRLNGGCIVTFRHPPNPKSQYVDEDRKRNSYIVNDDENFNERLGKLITMELLK